MRTNLTLNSLNYVSKLGEFVRLNSKHSTVRITFAHPCTTAVTRKQSDFCKLVQAPRAAVGGGSLRHARQQSLLIALLVYLYWPLSIQLAYENPMI